MSEHAQREGFLPISEAWYRDPGWQAAEAEADADIAEGRTRTFDNIEEMLEEFTAVRARGDCCP
jgi:hypothetical protein